MLSRVQQWGVALAFRGIAAAPVLFDLAERIGARLERTRAVADTTGDDLARLLSDLDALSDEAARALLGSSQLLAV